MKNHGPNIVLNQCGSSDMTQSYETIVITSAYSSTMAGAIVVMRR